MLSLLVITVAQVLAAGDHENEVHSEHSEGELATLESGLDCALVPLQNYNVGLHLAAVFIILAVSALGMFVTIYIGIAKKTPSTEKTMQILKMFGIGIIIGTVW